VNEMRVADYIFSCIAKTGVKQVFLLPGGGAMYLVDALGQNADLEFIPTHHEQAAAIAAEAYARVNENIGVALVTTGPGALNTLTAVAGAWIESVPLLIISGQVKRADMMRDSGVRQKGPQEVDIVSMVKPITKYAVTIEEPLDIRIHLEKALFLAKSGRQGPVWLDIPLDIQAASINPRQLTGYTPVQTDSKAINKQQVEKIIALISQSKKPLILAGHGIRLSGASEQFKQLYTLLNIPVVTTWNSLDLIPYEHPLCVGRPGSVALRCPNFAIQNCDLLISMGARLDNVVTAHNSAEFARNAKKIIVDIDENEINKHEMAIDIPVLSDARIFIESLLANLTKNKENKFLNWQQQCQLWKKKYPVCDGKAFPTSGEISHYHFVSRLSHWIKENELVITGSSGLAVEVFYSSFINKEGQRVFLTSGLGSMGYGLPAAIGGCLAASRKPVVSVEGDGSLQLNIQELSTLKQLNLPIRIFIMNNGGYASIRNTQRNYFDGRYVATGKEGNLFMPDIVKIAQAIDLDTISINVVEELDDKIEQALKHPGPLICDVRVTKDEALWPKVSAIPLENGSMMSMPMEDMSPLLTMDVLREEMQERISSHSVRARK